MLVIRALARPHHFYLILPSQAAAWKSSRAKSLPSTEALYSVDQLRIHSQATPTFLIAAVHLLLISQARAGYTHYFTWRKPPNEASVRSCVAEMNLLIIARSNLLVCPDEPESIPGSPKVQSSRVDFNGIGDKACEPFVFPGTVGFNFCKTSGEPYDEVVTACLLVARDHFNGSVLEISSDGSWQDWNSGANLYTFVLKRDAKNPMTMGAIVDFLLHYCILLTAAAVIVASIFYRRLKGRPSRCF